MTNQNLYGSQPQTQETGEEKKQAIGQQVLNGAGAGPELPQKMVIRSGSHSYTPLQLSMLQKNSQAAALMQVTQYLGRTQPAGGHEAIVSANQQLTLDRVTRSLADYLSALDSKLSVAEITSQTRDMALVLQRGFEASLATINEEYEKADKVLRRFQEETAKAASGSGGLFDTLGRVLNGYVRLPEAIKAFNDRESLNLKRGTHLASKEVMAQTVSMCERLLAGIESIHAAALTGAQEALQTAESILRETQAQGRIADYMVDTEKVMDNTGEADAVTGYLPELIKEARDNGGADIAHVAHGIATHAVANLLGALSLVELLKQEAARTEVNGKKIDPALAPLIVGAQTLDVSRRKRPSLRLTDDAHPRDFVLQIGNDAKPLFAHPNLITARYHKPRNEFAFMRVQAEVAVNELQVMRDGENDFNEALMRREFFINEEVIQAWRSRKGAAQTIARNPQPSPVTGYSELTAELVARPSTNGNGADQA